MLLRNSTNGKINIVRTPFPSLVQAADHPFAQNFNIYPGLKPSISKKALTFVGHSDGASQTYCVRLPSEEQANELKAALDREIEVVKAKESP
jgi:nucleoporin NUP2